MKIARRELLATAAAFVAPSVAPSVAQGETGLYGLIGKLVSAPGRRDDLIAILKQSTTGMPGCLSYVIAQDAADENAIWITEIWNSMADHEASLSLPAVKESIGKGRPLIAGGSRIAVTSPVAGVQR